jgi:hypothetical protein
MRLAERWVKILIGLLSNPKCSIHQKDLLFIALGLRQINRLIPGRCVEFLKIRNISP